MHELCKTSGTVRLNDHYAPSVSLFLFTRLAASVDPDSSHFVPSLLRTESVISKDS